MSRQISLYKDTKSLEKVCSHCIWIESLLLIFFVLLYVFTSFMMIEYPEDELSPNELHYFIVAAVVLAVLWWLIFKYYAFDLILSIELMEDTIYLRSMLGSYQIPENYDITWKEGITGENIIIIFRSAGGKKIKKYFRRYITFGAKKVNNLDITMLRNYLEAER